MSEVVLCVLGDKKDSESTADGKYLPLSSQFICVIVDSVVMLVRHDTFLLESVTVDRNNNMVYILTILLRV